MQEVAYNTSGLSLTKTARQLTDVSCFHGHENDPPKRVIGFSSGERSFSQLSLLVVPGLGIDAVGLALGAASGRRGGAAATSLVAGASAAAAVVATMVAVVATTRILVVVAVVVGFPEVMAPVKERPVAFPAAAAVTAAFASKCG
jgi:hypothetical protein